MRHWGLLLETDEHLRRLERRAKETNAPEDLARWRKGLVRAGHDHDHMKRHVDRWHTAHDELERARNVYFDQHGDYGTSRRDYEEAVREAKNQDGNLHKAASEFDQPVGKYAHPAGRSREQHFTRTAILHGSGLITRKASTRPEHEGLGLQIAKFAGSQRVAKSRALADALRRHYPKATIDDTPQKTDNGVIGRVEIRRPKEGS